MESISSSVDVSRSVQFQHEQHKRISIVVPAYNEERNIPVLYKKLTNLFETHLSSYDWDVTFVDDGSKDTTWQRIVELGNLDQRVRGAKLSRNFGHQIALSAAYSYAHGDAIVSLDCDMQDPPELIVQMVKEWEKGVDVVYARRQERKEGVVKKATAYIYYKLLDHVSDVRIPRNVGDFRLISKRVLDQINKTPERSRYLRGMVAWYGYPYAYVDFIRSERVHGVTGYTWKKMFKLAFDGITGFSIFPLKLAAYVGTFVIMTGSLMLAYISYDALINKVNYPLFKWLITIIYVFMGVQFLLLWLIGEYIGRMYDQQKSRPLFVVSEDVNVKERCGEAKNI